MASQQQQQRQTQTQTQTTQQQPAQPRPPPPPPPASMAHHLHLHLHMGGRMMRGGNGRAVGSQAQQAPQADERQTRQRNVTPAAASSASAASAAQPAATAHRTAAAPAAAAVSAPSTAALITAAVPQRTRAVAARSRLPSASSATATAQAAATATVRAARLAAAASRAHAAAAARARNGGNRGGSSSSSSSGSRISSSRIGNGRAPGGSVSSPHRSLHAMAAAAPSTAAGMSSAAAAATTAAAVTRMPASQPQPQPTSQQTQPAPAAAAAAGTALSRPRGQGRPRSPASPALHPDLLLTMPTPPSPSDDPPLSQSSAHSSPLPPLRLALDTCVSFECAAVRHQPRLPQRAPVVGLVEEQEDGKGAVGFSASSSSAASSAIIAPAATPPPRRILKNRCSGSQQCRSQGCGCSATRPAAHAQAAASPITAAATTGAAAATTAAAAAEPHLSVASASSSARSLRWAPKHSLRLAALFECDGSSSPSPFNFTKEERVQKKREYRRELRAEEEEQKEEEKEEQQQQAERPGKEQEEEEETEKKGPTQQHQLSAVGTASGPGSATPAGPAAQAASAAAFAANLRTPAATAATSAPAVESDHASVERRLQRADAHMRAMEHISQSNPARTAAMRQSRARVQVSSAAQLAMKDEDDNRGGSDDGSGDGGGSNVNDSGHDRSCQSLQRATAPSSQPTSSAASASQTTVTAVDASVSLSQAGPPPLPTATEPKTQVGVPSGSCPPFRQDVAEQDQTNQPSTDGLTRPLMVAQPTREQIYARGSHEATLIPPLQTQQRQQQASSQSNEASLQQRQPIPIDLTAAAPTASRQTAAAGCQRPDSSAGYTQPSHRHPPSVLRPAETVSLAAPTVLAQDGARPAAQPLRQEQGQQPEQFRQQRQQPLQTAPARPQRGAQFQPPLRSPHADAMQIDDDDEDAFDIDGSPPSSSSDPPHALAMTYPLVGRGPLTLRSVALPPAQPPRRGHFTSLRQVDEVDLRRMNRKRSWTQSQAQEPSQLQWRLQQQPSCQFQTLHYPGAVGDLPLMDSTFGETRGAAREQVEEIEQWPESKRAKRTKQQMSGSSSSSSGGGSIGASGGGRTTIRRLSRVAPPLPLTLAADGRSTNDGQRSAHTRAVQSHSAAGRGMETLHPSAPFNAATPLATWPSDAASVQLMDQHWRERQTLPTASPIVIMAPPAAMAMHGLQAALPMQTIASTAPSASSPQYPPLHRSAAVLDVRQPVQPTTMSSQNAGHSTISAAHWQRLQQQQQQQQAQQWRSFSMAQQQALGLASQAHEKQQQQHPQHPQQQPQQQSQQHPQQRHQRQPLPQPQPQAHPAHPPCAMSPSSPPPAYRPFIRQRLAESGVCSGVRGGSGGIHSSAATPQPQLQYSCAECHADFDWRWWHRHMAAHFKAKHPQLALQIQQGQKRQAERQGQRPRQPSIQPSGILMQPSASIAAAQGQAGSVASATSPPHPPPAGAHTASAAQPLPRHVQPQAQQQQLPLPSNPRQSNCAVRLQIQTHACQPQLQRRGTASAQPMRGGFKEQPHAPAASLVRAAAGSQWAASAPVWAAAPATSSATASSASDPASAVPSALSSLLTRSWRQWMTLRDEGSFRCAAPACGMLFSHSCKEYQLRRHVADAHPQLIAAAGGGDGNSSSSSSSSCISHGRLSTGQVATGPGQRSASTSSHASDTPASASASALSLGRPAPSGSARWSAQMGRA